MLDERCGIIVSRSAMSGMSARARVTSSRSKLTDRIASSHSGARPRTSPLRTRDERSAGKQLAAFAAHEIRERDEHAMLVGDVASEPIPATHARRSGNAVVLRRDATRRRRRANEDELRAVERGDRRGHAVPRILADEHRGASPRRVERANLASALDEPFLVEQTVGRQKHLAMDVSDVSARRRQV